MAINYPNGMSSSNNGAKKQKKQGQSLAPKTNFANRGMNFEDDINQSNDYYHNRKTAIIHKKPTPVQIVKVDYPRRSAAVIKEAYFAQASTTDYNGVYNGYYLDFEAKETKNKTSFPLRNFHEHQISHMRECREQKGISFVLLWFSSLGRCFFLDSASLEQFWEHQSTGKKSIPLTEIEHLGIEIMPGLAPRIPYLKAIDEYLKKEIQHNG